MIDSVNTVIYLVHVPRTGGTFLAHHLRRCTSLTLALYEHDVYSGERLARLAEHDKRVVTVAMLRDPVEHTRSLHDVARRDPSHHLHHLALCSTVMEYVKKRPGGVRDYFLRYFSPHPCTLAEALATLCHFDYVLDTASLTLQGNAMLAQLGETYRLPERDPPAVKVPITEDEIAYIKSERDSDYRLIEALAARGKANIRLEH